MAQLYVFIQFTSLILLILSGPFLPENLLSLVLYIFAGVVGSFALAAMRRSKIRVSPKVHPEAKLITTGIYRFIRHPMYLAVLLAGIGMLLNQITLFRIVLLLVLAVDLLFKMRFEERMLAQAFPSYPSYRLSSKRLIPYVW